MITLNPYLVFNGNCEEAFNFYKEVFDGEILFMGRYKDVPGRDRNLFPNSTDEQVMHATLRINAETVLMGNDSGESYGKSNAPIINNFFLYVSTGNKEEAYHIFDNLAKNGKIIMPIAETFWSTHYGMVTDRFGISWKITFDPEKK